MTTEFSRTQILLGEQAIQTLAHKKVAVFGIGGVGSFVAEALARSGVGSLLLVDKDTVSLTNINRQLIALHSTINKAKVSVMTQRIADINPKACVTQMHQFFNTETQNEFDLAGLDYIIDAIDTISAKILLIETAKKMNIPIISSMGAGNKLHPERFEIADIHKTSVCPLARVMRGEMRKRGIKKLTVVYSKEQPIKVKNQTTEEILPKGKHLLPGSVSFVPSAAGLIIAGEVIRNLIKTAQVTADIKNTTNKT
ncbi:MAG: tRNA threonylcarbamoyladenosine dehydratase [Treponemataceae bacterium]